MFLRFMFGLFALFGLAFGLVYFLSEQRIQHVYEVASPNIVIPSDQAVLQEGKRLFISRGCSDCHADNLAGRLIIDDTWLGLGQLAGSNLTQAAKNYTDAELVRAIRHGIGADNKPLLFMPSLEYYALTDEHVSKIVAYIRSVPVVENAPPLDIGWGMRWDFLMGKFPLLAAESIAHAASRPSVAKAAATPEYGAYLINSCTGCHGNALSGGLVPGVPADWPMASNLTPDKSSGLGDWSEQDFFKALQQGIRPDGSELHFLMPWKNYREMTKTEVKAIWLHLQSLAPRSFGES